MSPWPLPRHPVRASGGRGLNSLGKNGTTAEGGIDMSPHLLLVVLMLGAVAAGALLVPRRVWDLGFPAEATRLILTPLILRRISTNKRVQRCLVWRLEGEHVVAPAGSVAACACLTLRTCLCDYLALTQVLTLRDREREHTHAHPTHGRLRGPSLPIRSPRTSLQPAALRVTVCVVSIDTHLGALSPLQPSAAPGPGSRPTAPDRHTPFPYTSAPVDSPGGPTDWSSNQGLEEMPLLPSGLGDGLGDYSLVPASRRGSHEWSGFGRRAGSNTRCWSLRNSSRTSRAVAGPTTPTASPHQQARLRRMARRHRLVVQDTPQTRQTVGLANKGRDDRLERGRESPRTHHFSFLREPDPHMG
jgi:hypothetical protein